MLILMNTWKIRWLHKRWRIFAVQKRNWEEFGLKIWVIITIIIWKKILLLADVFENFIDVCLKLYGLNSCHYFCSPGLSWDTMLKMVGVGLEKIVDIDMYLFIEKGLRGRIFYIAKKYIKANNKYIKDYELKKLLK